MKRLLGPSIIIVVLVFSSPCQRQRELLPSLGVRRLLTFYILIFSETDLANVVMMGRLHM
jgi:hypothetical protein